MSAQTPNRNYQSFSPAEASTTAPRAVHYQPATGGQASTRESRTMAVLAVIANYGTKNDAYLHRLLDEYRSMTLRVHVTVLTNVPKSLGEDIEVIVHTPRGDPWSFPFAHKELFAQRMEGYDLFIYSEDDTLITEKNINAFLRTTEVLRENELAGFLRMERDINGDTYFPDVHRNFHWDPHSVVARGKEQFAFFTNEHSACYMLTREQLKRAIDSGGFLVGPHHGRYYLPESAATDPYTQCGFKKLICISSIGEFVLHHLPNKYIGKLGLCESDVLRQVAALKEIGNGTRDCVVLLNNHTKAANAFWCKNYYEQPRPDLLALIPSGTATVLSFGCGWGEMEADLLAKGYSVTAIPLDSVIGASAEARGVDVIYGESKRISSVLRERKFDCILLSDVLPLVPEPEHLLSSLARLLSPRGVIITVVPNMSRLRGVRRRMIDKVFLKGIFASEQGGVQLTSSRTVKKWLTRSGLRLARAIPVIPTRASWMHNNPGKLLGRVLASEFVFVAQRAGKSADLIYNAELHQPA